MNEGLFIFCFIQKKKKKEVDNETLTTTMKHPELERRAVRYFFTRGLEQKDEIERKFKPTAQIIAKISQLGSGHPNKTSFIDRYFDRDDFILSRQDMWLRKRNDQMELKAHNKVGLAASSALVGIDCYTEVRDVPSITSLIRQASMGTIHEISTLTPFAEIATHRSRFHLDLTGNRFFVDIDYCDFFTSVGTSASPSGSYSIGEIEIDTLKEGFDGTQAIEEAFRELNINPQPVRGKVLEFLFRYHPNHYQALISSGLVGKKIGIAETSAVSLLRGRAVNMHFTRKCNYGCKFCFHTQTNINILPIGDQRKVIKMLRGAGADKLNFAGGEPFLYPKLLGEMCETAKEQGFSSVSIITNASLISEKNSRIREEFFKPYGKFVDVIGVSCDTDNTRTNFEHGRYPKPVKGQVAKFTDKVNQLNNIRATAALCKEFGIKFKVNTVVTKLNMLDDLAHIINELDPVRWKVFQVLAIDGENSGNQAINKVASLLITPEEFQRYVDRNRMALKNPSIMECEDNATMRDSYILVDENGSFLDTAHGGKVPTASMLKVGIDEAARQLLSFDEMSYIHRNGDWYKKC